MKAVTVIWYDVFDISGWLSVNDMAVNFPSDQKGQLVRTRGWLYAQDEYKIVVARDWASDVTRTDEESLRGTIAIPKGMVKEIIEEEEIAGTN